MYRVWFVRVGRLPPHQQFGTLVATMDRRLVGVSVALLDYPFWASQTVTLIEFILSVAVVGMVVLQCVILIELRRIEFLWGLAGSKRRRWTHEERN